MRELPKIDRERSGLIVSRIANGIQNIRYLAGRGGIAGRALGGLVGEMHDLFSMKTGGDRVKMLCRQAPVRIAPGALHEIELALDAFDEAGAQLRFQSAIVASGGGKRVIEGAGMERHAIDLDRRG